MSKTQETRKQGLDKFYTKSDVVSRCLNSLLLLYKWRDWGYVVEPSAGNGSFFHRIPDCVDKIGLDISPDDPDIVQYNFFHYSPSPDKKNILCIGNPPFGKNSSLAVKFFNHASTWSSVIAFIVPRTFRRVSIQNKLNLDFQLVHDEDIPISPCSFEPPMSVKCCFQIWKRSSHSREKSVLETSHPDWTFLQYTKDKDSGVLHYPENAHFALRAYGGKCGEIRTAGFQDLKPKSWHWIHSNIQNSILLSRFDKIDYSISKNTARQNSIGKGDLVVLYKTLINSETN
jgi:hypothetical protein